MSRMGDTIRSARLQAKMTEKALGKKCGMAENVIKTSRPAAALSPTTRRSAS